MRPSPGAHTTPTRGLNDFAVGFLNSGPMVTVGSVRLIRFDVLPSTSVGTEANSYRRPMLSVTSGRTCQLSCTYVADQVLTQVAERVVAAGQHHFEPPRDAEQEVLHVAELVDALAAAAARLDVVAVVRPFTARSIRVIAANQRIALLERVGALPVRRGVGAIADVGQPRDVDLAHELAVRTEQEGAPVARAERQSHLRLGVAVAEVHFVERRAAQHGGPLRPQRPASCSHSREMRCRWRRGSR